MGFNRASVTFGTATQIYVEKKFKEKILISAYLVKLCEKKFSKLLTRENFTHHLSLIRSVRRYGAHRKVFTKPLFPGYVFARIEPERKTRVYQQDLLVRAIMIENETVFLRQLEDVKIICASGLEAALHPLMRKGTHVRVQGGPLNGL